MIDGLGITGYEGIFLKVCEITLSVLRTHKETLMTVLETFIHDPLVEWTKTNKSSKVFSSLLVGSGALERRRMPMTWHGGQARQQAADTCTYVDGEGEFGT